MASNPLEPPPSAIQPTSPPSTLVFCETCGSLQLRAVTKQLQKLFDDRSVKPNVCGICKKSVEPFHISQRLDIARDGPSKQPRKRQRKQTAPKAHKVYVDEIHEKSTVETSNVEPIRNNKSFGCYQPSQVGQMNQNNIVGNYSYHQYVESGVTQQGKPFYRIKLKKIGNKPSTCNTTPLATKVYQHDKGIGVQHSRPIPVSTKDDNIEVQAAGTGGSLGKVCSDQEQQDQAEIKQESCAGTEAESTEHVDPDLLALMMPSNDPQKPFKCKFCYMDAFRHLKTFQEHVRSHTRKEPKEKPYKCIMCYTKYSTADECASHKASNCTPCTEADMLEIIRWLDSQVIAMMGTAVRVQAPFRCKYCTFMESRTVFQFIRHQQDKHPERHPGVDLDHLMKNGYKCCVCEQRFQNLVNVKHHHMHHTGERPFKCDYEGCDKAFRNKNELKQHIRIHDKERKFKCDQCNGGFIQKADLQGHIRNVHLKIRPFQCPHCDTTWPSTYRMENHINRIHLKLKPVMCELCGRSFASNAALNLHKTVHSGEKKYKCDQCDFVTARLTSLKIHKRQHTGEKPYKCSRCGKAFVQRISLTQHLRNHHGDAKALARAGTSGGSLPGSTQHRSRAKSKTMEVTESGESKTGQVTELGESKSGQVTELSESKSGQVTQLSESKSGQVPELGESKSGQVTELGESKTGQVTELSESKSGQVTELGESDFPYVSGEEQEDVCEVDFGNLVDDISS